MHAARNFLSAISIDKHWYAEAYLLLILIRLVLGLSFTCLPYNMESDNPEVEIISLEFDAETIAETLPKTDPHQNPILLEYLIEKFFGQNLWNTNIAIL